jgi:hypothetical protein
VGLFRADSGFYDKVIVAWLKAKKISHMNHSFCAGQLGHSVDIFQRTYTTWIKGQQGDQEMARWEAAMATQKAKPTAPTRDSFLCQN